MRNPALSTTPTLWENTIGLPPNCRHHLVDPPHDGSQAAGTFGTGRPPQHPVCEDLLYRPFMAVAATNG